MLPVPRRGPHPVWDHTPPLHTCGRDESPSTTLTCEMPSSAHLLSPHSTLGAGYDSPHQTCNEAAAPSPFNSSSLGAIESFRIQRLPYSFAKHRTRETESCSRLRKTLSEGRGDRQNIETETNPGAAKTVTYNSHTTPRLSGLRADQRTIRMGYVDVNPVSRHIQKHPSNVY